MLQHVVILHYNGDGLIVDRRAGRISTQDNIRLCGILDGMVIEGVRIIVKPVKEHRCIVVLRGDGLSSSLNDTDPQILNVKPKDVVVLEPDAAKTARVVNLFLQKAKDILSQYYPANMLLLRGFSSLPNLSNHVRDSINSDLRLLPVILCTGDS